MEVTLFSATKPAVALSFEGQFCQQGTLPSERCVASHASAGSWGLIALMRPKATTRRAWRKQRRGPAKPRHAGGAALVLGFSGLQSRGRRRLCCEPEASSWSRPPLALSPGQSGCHAPAGRKLRHPSLRSEPASSEWGSGEGPAARRGAASGATAGNGPGRPAAHPARWPGPRAAGRGRGRGRSTGAGAEHRLGAPRPPVACTPFPASSVTVFYKLTLCYVERKLSSE